MSVSSIQALLMQQAASAKTGGTGGVGLFESLLGDALAASVPEGAPEDTALSGGLLANDRAGLIGGDLTQELPLLLAAREEGGDLKSAVMTFCMLMGTGVSGASLGAAMASLSAALSGVPAGELESLRFDSLNSLVAQGYDRAGLSRANDMLFSGSANEARTPFSASKAASPEVTSQPGARSAPLYRQAIDQFQVESNPRYAVNKKGQNDTYCNIFLWDVTRAMGAEIPHYVDKDTLEARYYPDTSGARELNANGIYDWLADKGGEYGWVQVTPAQAQALANRGMPAVTAWKNPTGGHGHVQVVCPSADGAYDPARGVTIAQAGRRLTGYAPITEIYSQRLGSVVYYAHA